MAIQFDVKDRSCIPSSFTCTTFIALDWCTPLPVSKKWISFCLCCSSFKKK